jgi:hypothetical protein
MVLEMAEQYSAYRMAASRSPMRRMRYIEQPRLGVRVAMSLRNREAFNAPLASRPILQVRLR